jgi:hypothetical protein
MEHKVTSAKYYGTPENPQGCILATINGQVTSVPKNDRNSDYQRILLWVADGNTITAAGG